MIKLKGKPFNPLEDDDSSIFSEDIMQNLLNNYEKVRMIYRYEGGFNEIRALSPREIKNLKIPGGSNTISILLAIVFAMIMQTFSPQTQDLIAKDIVTPILDTLLGALIAINVPLIFISIVSSMCTMENVSTLNSLGTTVLMRFLKILLFISVITIFVSLILFPVLDFEFGGQMLSSNTDEDK